MQSKSKSIIIAVIAVIVGYVVSHPLLFRMCAHTYQFNDRIGCLDGSVKTIGSPLLIFSLWALFVVAVVTFLPENFFKSWFKFATWTIPLLVIFIALTPDSNPGTLIDILPFYRDDAARLAGGIFSAASLILILWKYCILRHRSAL